MRKIISVILISMGLLLGPFALADGGDLSPEYQINDSHTLAESVYKYNKVLGTSLEIAWRDFMNVHDFVYTSQSEHWASVTEHSRQRFAGREALDDLQRAIHGQVVSPDEKMQQLVHAFNRLIPLRRKALAVLAQNESKTQRLIRGCIRFFTGEPRMVDHE